MGKKPSNSPRMRTRRRYDGLAFGTRMLQGSHFDNFKREASEVSRHHVF